MNARARRTGHLSQRRFASVVLDEEHLMLAARQSMSRKKLAPHSMRGGNRFCEKDMRK